jgi:hypothetical protein
MEVHLYAFSRFAMKKRIERAYKFNATIYQKIADAKRQTPDWLCANRAPPQFWRSPDPRPWFSSADKPLASLNVMITLPAFAVLLPQSH